MIPTVRILPLLAFILFTPALGEEKLLLADQMAAIYSAPKKGTFATPESVIRAFYKAVFSGDDSEAAKCFPIESLYKLSNFRTDVTNVGVYSPESIPLPGDRLSRFAYAYSRFSSALSRVRLDLLIAREPDANEILFKTNNIRKESGGVSDEKIQALIKKLDVSSFEDFKIKELNRIGIYENLKQSGILPISNMQNWRVTIQKGETQITHEVHIALHRGNYQFIGIETNL